MLLSLLALTLATGDHAKLHPTDADLFIGVPEAQNALTATKSVGVNSLLRAPEITAAIGEEIDFASGPDWLTGALGLDGAEAELLMGELSAFSFSVAGLDEFESAPPFEEMEVEEIFALALEHDLLLVLEFKTAAGLEAGRAASEQLMGDMVGTESSHETQAGLVKVTDYDLMFGVSGRGAWVAEWGTSTAFGVGAEGAPGLLSRLRGGESLATTERWVQGEGAMKEGGGVQYMTYHHNLIGDPWYALAVIETELPLPRILLSGVELLFGGLFPMGASEGHGACRIVGGEYVIEGIDFRRPRVEGGKQLPADFLNLVNAEAVGVWATTFDAKELSEMVLETAATQTGLPTSTIEAEFEYSVGVSMEDLVAPLSDNAAFYMLPINGLTLPRIHCVVKLNDAAAYTEAWTKLSEFLKVQGGQYVEVEDRPYRKVPIFSLKSASTESAPSFGGGEGPLSGIASMGLTNPALTVAILSDRAVFGLSSSYVKREVRRLLKEEESTPHPLAESGACPEGAEYFGHLDWPSVLGGIYDTAMAFLPLIADGGALPIDIDALPETEAITQHFSSARVWSKAEELGTYTIKRTPIGFDLVLQGGLLAAPFFTQEGQAERAFEGDFEVEPGEAPTVAEGEEEWVEIEKEESAEGPALEEALRRTRLALQEVKLGLVIYKSEGVGFPRTLEELLAPTQAYPKGFLNTDALPVDGWEGALIYVHNPEDGSYRLWSAGPDGINNEGAGDDLSSR